MGEVNFGYRSKLLLGMEYNRSSRKLQGEMGKGSSRIKGGGQCLKSMCAIGYAGVVEEETQSTGGRVNETLQKTSRSSEDTAQCHECGPDGDAATRGTGLMGWAGLRL